MSRIDQIICGMITTTCPSIYWDDPDEISIDFQELEASRVIMQHNGQSVWQHTMDVIDLLTIKNPITLLSGLFHDLGKGCITPIDDPSRSKFPGHADASAAIAERKLSEWGANKHLSDRVVRLVSTHMFDISQTIRDRTIRKFVADVGRNNIGNWFVLRIADSRSYSAHAQYYSHFIKPFQRVIMSYLKQQPDIDQPEPYNKNIQNTIQIEGGDN